MDGIGVEGTILSAGSRLRWVTVTGGWFCDDVLLNQVGGGR